MRTPRTRGGPLNHLKPNLDPKIWQWTLKGAAIFSIQTASPQANINECFFHLCQAVYRAVVRLGLKADYSTDQNFTQQNRALSALVFLDVNDVVDTFDKIGRTISRQKKACSVVFRKTYIGVKIAWQSIKNKSFVRAGGLECP